MRTAGETRPRRGPPDPSVGLCSVCRHARVQRTVAAVRYWRCTRAASDPAYRRYPPLPVQVCPGFEELDDPEVPEPRRAAGRPSRTRGGRHRGSSRERDRELA